MRMEGNYDVCFQTSGPVLKISVACCFGLITKSGSWAHSSVLSNPTASVPYHTEQLNTNHALSENVMLLFQFRQR